MLLAGVRRRSRSAASSQEVPPALRRRPAAALIEEDVTEDVDANAAAVSTQHYPSPSETSDVAEADEGEEGEAGPDEVEAAPEDGDGEAMDEEEHPMQRCD